MWHLNIIHLGISNRETIEKRGKLIEREEDVTPFQVQYHA